MNENSETSIHSARALMEYSQRQANDAKKNEVAANKTSPLASEQVVLLRESNELAKIALLEAQKASADSENTSKKAFWSNIIAVASLIIAIASLVFTVLSRGT